MANNVDSLVKEQAKWLFCCCRCKSIQVKSKNNEEDDIANTSQIKHFDLIMAAEMGKGHNYNVLYKFFL